MELFSAILEKTYRVCLPHPAELGDGHTLARQLDAALLKVGFALSSEVMRELGLRSPTQIQSLSELLLPAVRSWIGDDEHNVVFKDFPAGVPDTLAFWRECLDEALAVPELREELQAQLEEGQLNLLLLPRYGRAPHSYEELLVARAELEPHFKGRLTLLHLGGDLEQVALELFGQLAGSAVPLSEADRGFLGFLAQRFVSHPVPETIPVRENRALINAARIRAGLAPVANTVTDFLRAAAALSDGDVGLVQPVRFKSFPRAWRRTLLRALDALVLAEPEKLRDVKRHMEPWKRLGERLHANAYPELLGARRVFAVARGELDWPSLDTKVERLLSKGDVLGVMELLRGFPGVLVRRTDQLLRLAPEHAEVLFDALNTCRAAMSARVLLQLRAHLLNPRGELRLFQNSKGMAWVQRNELPPMEPRFVERLSAWIDQEIETRIPQPQHLIVHQDALGLALPLSQKLQADGFGVMPRGSQTPVPDWVRFFIHWKQAVESTDLDLSVQLFDADFESLGHVSWTALKGKGMVHSGDIVDAPDGAFEAIEVDLNKTGAHYVVPVVLVYSGEGFRALEESLFGYMALEPKMAGMPFEARAVRLKSELRGSGKVALPLVFEKQGGAWQVRWMHLYLSGLGVGTTLEGVGNQLAAVVRAGCAYRPLSLAYWIQRAHPRRFDVCSKHLPEHDENAVYIGLERPEGLALGVKVYTPENLVGLIPE